MLKKSVCQEKCIRLALNNGRPNIALISWSAWHRPAERERILNKDDPADIIYDITPWHLIKVAAALCHRTQHAMFLRNSGAASFPQMVWKTETLRTWRDPLARDL
jgi:hypothetical protein